MTLSSDPHLDDLLGAYALDAVDLVERAVVEAHLAECPRCETEVREHQEVAAILSSTSLSAPEHLWRGIEEEIAPPNVIQFTRRRRSWGSMLTAVAAAVAVALMSAVFVQSQRVDELSDQIVAEQAEIASLTQAITADPLAAAIDAALADETSRIVTLEATGADGSGTATVVLRPDGTGFVIDDDLPVLGEGETYQLWAVTDDRVVSAGLFGTSLERAAFRVDPGVAVLAITPEVSGGVVVSEADAVAVASLEG